MSHFGLRFGVLSEEESLKEKVLLSLSKEVMEEYINAEFKKLCNEFKNMSDSCKKDMERRIRQTKNEQDEIEYYHIHGIPVCIER